MPASTKQPVRGAAATDDRKVSQTRRRSRESSAEIKAEIEFLKKKIERGLIELNAQADLLMPKGK
jgi:hypothetical protein